tara:strand:+ start:372 stop:521 length:150 start_codon:yes stop_codon:yes gene_type:complete
MVIAIPMIKMEVNINVPQIENIEINKRQIAKIKKIVMILNEANFPEEND